MNLDNIGIKRLPHDKEKIFRRILSEIRMDSRFDSMTNFIQHGDTTVREHCIHVAETAYFIAIKFGIDVDEEALIRGALLHDYFLYDWHEKSAANMIHGFTHPRKAYNKAKEDFALSRVEADMIIHHMFPLTPNHPKTKEGAILCIADKLCATGETIRGKLPWRV